MSSWTNVHFIILFDKYQVGKNVRLDKCLGWTYVWLDKCLVGQTSGWTNVQLGKRRLDKPRLDKRQLDKRLTTVGIISAYL